MMTDKKHLKLNSNLDMHLAHNTRIRYKLAVLTYRSIHGTAPRHQSTLDSTWQYFYGDIYRVGQKNQTIVKSA